jgi:flavin-dependent dehydrogenase
VKEEANMENKKNYDVIIIGGGPAGSAAAAVLAQNGWRVIVLEKEKFPRYHIGESLIPFSYFPLKRIGMIEKLEKSHFPKKYSVQFARMNGEISVPFYFFKHFQHDAAVTWQVVRSEFDQMVLENAREKGAEVIQGIKAREAIYEGEAVTGLFAEDESGQTYEFRAPITIDASGRAGFFRTRNDWRIPDIKLQKMAVWTYYKGALRDPGLDEGATTVAYVPEKGWFWYIPLPKDRVSVGVVAEKDYLYNETRDLAAIFHREVEKNLWIKEHLSHGQGEGEYFVTGDYSYRAQYCAADGVVLAGDAFAFLDPVFSSGLYLALFSGSLAADAVDEALRLKDYSAARFADYGEKFCIAIETMRRLVYAFYDHNFSFRKLFQKYPAMAGDVTDCLIGNSEKDYSELFKAISEFAEVPEPLSHGKPFVKHLSEYAERSV